MTRKMFVLLTISERYKAHVLNLRALQQAHTQIARQLNYAVSAEQVTASDALLKTFVFLLGAWSEVRLLKLLHEPDAFLDAERARIFAGQTQLDKWKITLEIGFRRRYGVSTAPLSVDNLPATAFFRYHELENLLNQDLAPIISIRNRLAHGQWARTFNAVMDDISIEMMEKLNTENALSCKFKRSIIEYISRIIHDLIVGGEAFERDFDQHFGSVTTYQRELTNRPYDEWERRQISKLRNGREKRP